MRMTPKQIDAACDAIADAAALIRAQAERVLVLEEENARLEKERAYAVRWGERSLESVKEVMWRYEDALKLITEMDGDQPARSNWDMLRIARAALNADGAA